MVFLEALGRHVLSSSVSSVLRSFFRFATPKTIIRGATVLWGSNFRGSSLRVVKSGASCVQLAIDRVDFCQRGLRKSLLAGMQATLERAGAKTITALAAPCEKKSGCCQLRFAWR
jgi:hypothetical protein